MALTKKTNQSGAVVEVEWLAVLAFNSDDPSSNPANACSFFCKVCV